MNTVFTPHAVVNEPADISELPVEQLPTLLRQISTLAVPILLIWGAGNRPLMLSGRLTEVIQKANWLQLCQTSQQQAHIALSLLAEVFICSPSRNGELTLIGHDKLGQCCLSISYEGRSKLERMLWQKVIHTSCHSDNCYYSC